MARTLLLGLLATSLLAASYMADRKAKDGKGTSEDNVGVVREHFTKEQYDALWAAAVHEQVLKLSKRRLERNLQHELQANEAQKKLVDKEKKSGMLLRMKEAGSWIKSKLGFGEKALEEPIQAAAPATPPEQPNSAAIEGQASQEEALQEASEEEPLGKAKPEEATSLIKPPTAGDTAAQHPESLVEGSSAMAPANGTSTGTCCCSQPVVVDSTKDWENRTRIDANYASPNKITGTIVTGVLCQKCLYLGYEKDQDWTWNERMQMAALQGDFSGKEQYRNLWGIAWNSDMDKLLAKNGDSWLRFTVEENPEEEQLKFWGQGCLTKDKCSDEDEARIKAPEASCSDASTRLVKTEDEAFGYPNTAQKTGWSKSDAPFRSGA